MNFLNNLSVSIGFKAVKDKHINFNEHSILKNNEKIEKKNELISF